MKYKSLFALAAASLTMLFACEKPVELGPEEVTIVSSDVPEEIPMVGGEYTVELKATLDWTVQNYEGEDVASWLSITPSNGKASADNQTIAIKVSENPEANRSFDIVFYGDIMHKATLTIFQQGPEGEAGSMTVAEFIEKADTENEYVLTGVIGDIATNVKYWGFTLKDETGTISCPFIGENVDEFLAMDMHTGDSVSIKGVYEFYSSKNEHQLSDGVVMSHKPVSIDGIETVSVSDFIAAADPFTMYRLTGEVSSSVNTQYCSFDLKDDTGTIVVWTVNNASDYANTLKKGDKVTLRGAYMWYEDESKHEVVDATIENVEAGETPVVGTPEGNGTAEDPYNVAAAYKFIDDGKYYGDADNPNVSPEKYVKGVITSIEEVDTGQYGNATYVISDGEGTAELEVYRGYYLNGEKFTSKDQIKVGDEVVVVGQLTRFFETYEFTKGSKIYSINDGGSGGEDPDDPTEEPTSATPITIAEFLQKPVNNTDWYELTGEIVSIVSGNAYGNFTIKDDTGSVYIYGMVQAWAGGKNDQSFNKIGLKVGDSVTLWSLRDEHDGQPQGGGSDIPAIYKSHEEGATVTYPEGTVFLTFPDGNQKSVSSYTDTWTAICDGYTFTIANFNNNKNGWSYIKCGREKAASVATIANATAMPELSSIEVSVDNVTKASSVNSVTLTIYSDEANSSQVGEPIAWTDYSAGVWEFAIPEGVQAENLYYKLTFDCAPHGSSNGIIQISKVTYIAAE